jgi:hypothetical protein
VLVCELEDVEDDDVSDDDDPDDVVAGAELVGLAELAVLAPAWAVVAVSPSRQASTPPRPSAAATLSTVAARRAPAARGLRRGTRVRPGAGGASGVVSSMEVTVRTSREAPSRTR